MKSLTTALTLVATAAILMTSISQAAPPGATPIAEIKLLLGRAVQVGDRVRLAATEVLDKDAKYSWRLLQKPRMSRAVVAERKALEASFLADVPGLYVVELTVQVRSQKATATLGVTATEAGPLVAVNTLDVDADGNPGMTVGSQFYPDPSDGTQFHILVLDRNTLEMLYNYSDPVTSPAIASMQTDFEALTNASLVFVALPASALSASAGALSSSLVGTLNNALGVIGGLLPAKWILSQEMINCWSSQAPYCYSAGWSTNNVTYGSFSVIGVPGMSAGDAFYDSAAQRGTTQGALIGYLTPGVAVGSVANANAYTFVFRPDQYVLVDSCVSGGPSACVIGVGSQTFPPAGGVDGLNVVLLDRITLVPIAHQTVTSTTALTQLLSSVPIITPGHYQISISSDRIVVVIQSVGTGQLTYNAAEPLLQQIDQLGGTPETFGPAITQGKPYALIGVAGNLPWHGLGIESSPVINSSEPGRSRGCWGAIAGPATRRGQTIRPAWLTSTCSRLFIRIPRPGRMRMIRARFPTLRTPSASARRIPTSVRATRISTSLGATCIR
jgi:hypothetical protein